MWSGMTAVSRRYVGWLTVRGGASADDDPTDSFGRLELLTHRAEGSICEVCRIEGVDTVICFRGCRGRTTVKVNPDGLEGFKRGDRPFAWTSRIRMGLAVSKILTSAYHQANVHLFVCD